MPFNLGMHSQAVQVLYTKVPFGLLPFGIFFLTTLNHKTVHIPIYSISHTPHCVRMLTYANSNAHTQIHILTYLLTYTYSHTCTKIIVTLHQDNPYNPYCNT